MQGPAQSCTPPPARPRREGAVREQSSRRNGGGVGGGRCGRGCAKTGSVSRNSRPRDGREHKSGGGCVGVAHDAGPGRHELEGEEGSGDFRGEDGSERGWPTNAGSGSGRRGASRAGGTGAGVGTDNGRSCGTCRRCGKAGRHRGGHDCCGGWNVGGCVAGSAGLRAVFSLVSGDFRWVVGVVVVWVAVVAEVAVGH